MSFINLMGNDYWHLRDITARTEAIIAAEFSNDICQIMSRKLTAQMAGYYTLTPEETIWLTSYTEVCEKAAEEGILAVADRELLKKVFKYERLISRLALPQILEPLTVLVYSEDGVESEIINPALAIDIMERNQAISLVEQADKETTDLYLLRHPIVIIEEEELNAQ